MNSFVIKSRRRREFLGGLKFVHWPPTLKKNTALHTLGASEPIGDLSSSSPSKYLELWRVFWPIVKIRSGVVFGAENWKKSGSERGEQDSKLSRFPRFSPRHREKIDRTIFLLNHTAPSGHFELLRSKIGPLRSNLCKIHEKMGRLPPLSQFSR